MRAAAVPSGRCAGGLQIYILWYFINIDVGGFKYIDNIYDHDAIDIV